LKILLSSFLVILIDQITKFWIKTNYLLGSSHDVIGDFFRITFVENPGVAFGINVGKYLPIITILSLFAIGLVSYYLYIEREKRVELRLGLALILGGAIGNLIDRLFMLMLPGKYTGVVDFIDIGFRDYRWYIFNIADSSVTIGITLVLLYSLFLTEKTH